MCGITKLGRIRNTKTRGTTEVGEISKKVQKSRFKWYGQVTGGEQKDMVVKVMGAEIEKGTKMDRWTDQTESEKELRAKKQNIWLLGGN